MKQTIFVIQELVSREMKRNTAGLNLGFYGVSQSLTVYDRSLSGVFHHVPEIH